jgi:coniferyl-aldehyde dehydrogenase
MAACARNLTPVTLELGGKSPAVIAPDYSLGKAVERIMFAKLFNAGQACVGVDYCFVPEDRLEAFVAGCRDYVARHYPDIGSTDYTSIIDERAFERLQGALANAAGRGARLINLSEGHEADPQRRKLPPHLVMNVNDDMELMRREIFGPILPVLPYREPREVVDYIASRDRPLAFYPFTHDRRLQKYYLDRVMSGGVCVNDALLQVAQHDLPFGGVGASGMGHYHGREGFEAFSKLRPVFYQSRFSAMKLLAPPYGRRAERIIALLLRLKS